MSTTDRIDHADARPRAGIDGALCEALAARAATGDAAAWKALVEHLFPWVRGLVERSRIMGSMGRSADDVHDVLAKLWDRLGRHGGRGLALYAPWRERNPDKTFEDWIRIVTVNEIRRHVRAKLARVAEADAGSLPSAKRFLNELSLSPAVEDLGIRPPVTAAQTAQQLLVFARERLSSERYRALGLWIEGASFEEIASELELGDAVVARSSVRAAVAVLRRQFVEGAAGP